MNYRWLFFITVAQTLMFVVLILYTARMEDRLAARMAAMEVALTDLRHVALGGK